MDDIKAAEKRGYSKGYAAGRRRKARDLSDQRRRTEREAFRRRAFLAALPACIAAQGWKRGDKPIASVDDRAQLAWDFAAAAVKGLL